MIPRWPTYIGIGEVKDASLPVTGIKRGNLALYAHENATLAFNGFFGQILASSALARINLAEASASLVGTITLLGLFGIVSKTLASASLVSKEVSVALKVSGSALAVRLLRLRNAILVIDTAGSISLATPVRNLMGFGRRKIEYGILLLD